MPRKPIVLNRQKIQPDTLYQSTAVTALANAIMRHGKKQCALKIVYGALTDIKNQWSITNESDSVTTDEQSMPTNEKIIKMLTRSIENITPRVEVRSQRIGGGTHQVPKIITPARGNHLAHRFIRKAMEIHRKNTTFKPGDKASQISLAIVLLNAYDNKGEVAKMCADMHRMARSNQAYANVRTFSPV